VAWSRVPNFFDPSQCKVVVWSANIGAANPDRPLYLAEICAAMGIAERTLRAACEEHLRMGPTFGEAPSRTLRRSVELPEMRPDRPTSFAATNLRAA
jgi:hypothetical protein